MFNRAWPLFSISTKCSPTLHHSFVSICLSVRFTFADTQSQALSSPPPSSAPTHSALAAPKQSMAEPTCPAICALHTVESMRDITILVDGLFWSFSQCSKPLLDTPMYRCIVTSLLDTLPSLSRVCQPPRTTLLNTASPSALTIYIVVHGGRRDRAREAYAQPQHLAAALRTPLQLQPRHLYTQHE